MRLSQLFTSIIVLCAGYLGNEAISKDSAVHAILAGAALIAAALFEIKNSMNPASKSNQEQSTNKEEK